MMSDQPPIIPVKHVNTVEDLAEKLQDFLQNPTLQSFQTLYSHPLYSDWLQHGLDITRDGRSVWRQIEFDATREDIWFRNVNITNVELFFKVYRTECLYKLRQSQ